MATFRQTTLCLRYIDYTRPSNVLISRHFTTSVSRLLLSNKNTNTQKQKFTSSNDQQSNQSKLPVLVQTFRRKLLERYEKFKTSDTFYRAWHGTICSGKDDGTITQKEKKMEGLKRRLSAVKATLSMARRKEKDCKCIENLTYEQKLDDALEAFNDSLVKDAGSDITAKQLKYGEVMLEHLNAFKDCSVRSQKCNSKHLLDSHKLESMADVSENLKKDIEINKQIKYEESMFEHLNAFKDNSDQSQRYYLKDRLDNQRRESIADVSRKLNEQVEIELPSNDGYDFLDRMSNESKTSVDREQNKITNINIITSIDAELQNTIRSILKNTHFSLTLQTSKIPRVSVGFRKPTKESNSYVLLAIHERTRKRKSRSKSSPGEILQMLLSKEEQKILKKMIETEVRKRMNGISCGNGSERFKCRDTRMDSKMEQDIDNLSQEILVNLMAQVLKHTLIKHKLKVWTEWLKKGKNQKKVLKMLFSLAVFILRFKFLAGLILPDVVDSMATVEMFSSFTMGSDMKAEFKSTSIIDVGKFQDGKSVVFTSTTIVDVVPGEKDTAAK